MRVPMHAFDRERAFAVLFAQLDGASAPFDAALGKAFDLHARYWTRDDRRDDPSGFLSIQLAAAMALARSRGPAFTASSGYAPESIRAALV
jgi:hypothetical protein